MNVDPASVIAQCRVCYLPIRVPEATSVATLRVPIGGPFPPMPLRVVPAHHDCALRVEERNR